ncbi:MAG: hypothetical protein R3E50_02340 [Halioglobus sp.]
MNGAEFYWQSIALQQFDFAGREALAAAVQALTLQDWKDYYERVFLQQRHSLQVVAPGKGASCPGATFMCITPPRPSSTGMRPT